MTPARRHRLFAALLTDLGAILALVVLLMLVRVGLLLGLSERVASTEVVEWLRCLGMGLRFDLQAGLLLGAPLLLMSLLSGWWDLGAARHRVRLIWWTVTATATAVAGGADWFYFREFGTQFDQRMLEPLHEDLGALAATIWRGYPVVWAGLGAVALALLCTWAGSRVLLQEARWVPRLARIPRPALALLVLAGLPVLVAAGRGSISGRPLQRATSGVTRDATLNRLIPTPWHAVRSAVTDHVDLQRDAGLAALLTPAEIRPAAVTLFGTSAGGDLDACVRQAAQGADGIRPEQVVLVLLEGQSGFPLFARHRGLGLTPHLADLAERGMYLQRFLPASGGTIYSLGALFTGIPDSGVVPSLAPLARQPFPTSLAPTFTRLGYHTRFLYGGFLESKRYGAFAHEQGFAEVRGVNDMGEGARNSWGIDDASLFRTAERILAEETGPSFTLILTTSNHPPFEADVAAAGFDTTALAGKVAPGSDLKGLSHLWYNDHCVGRFAQALERRFPALLLAITGDHPSRRWVEAIPPVPERTSVPLILFGPQVLAGRSFPPGTVGDHLDLVRTLIERCAPAGFGYHAWGRDLLLPDEGEHLASGAYALCTRQDWIDVTVAPEAQGVDPQRFAELFARYRVKHGLGWWRLMRGASLPP
jgi:phosphoglycerol transferase MdoB-like AlkP superfamily enzyme